MMYVLFPELGSAWCMAAEETLLAIVALVMLMAYFNFKGGTRQHDDV